MYVTCHVLGASGKIKHLFMWDSKESVDILVCIFAKSLASKALLQLIACSIKECTAKYWFQGFSCVSVSGTSALPHLSSYPQLIFQLLLSLPHNLNKNKGLFSLCACVCLHVWAVSLINDLHMHLSAHIHAHQTKPVAHDQKLRLKCCVYAACSLLEPILEWGKTTWKVCPYPQTLIPIPPFFKSLPPSFHCC